MTTTRNHHETLFLVESKCAKRGVSWKQLRSRQTCSSLVNGTTDTASARTTITRNTGQQRTINIRGRGKKVIPRALMAGYNEPIGKTKTSSPGLTEILSPSQPCCRSRVEGRRRGKPLPRCCYMLLSTASSVSLSRHTTVSFRFLSLSPPPLLITQTNEELVLLSSICV